MKIIIIISTILLISLFSNIDSSKTKKRSNSDPNFEIMKSNVLQSKEFAETLMKEIDRTAINKGNDKENWQSLKTHIDKFKSAILRSVDDENSISNLCCDCIKNFNSYLSKMKNFEQSTKVDNYLSDLGIINLDHLPTYKALYSIFVIKKLKFWS